MDKYTQKYLKKIKACMKDNDMEALNLVINKIYEDGFEDGANAEK